MGKSRNRILGLTAAAMAVGVVACEDTSTEVVTQPDGAVLGNDVTSAGAALDGAATVEVDFRATWNHDLGEFEIETLSQHVSTPLLEMQDGAILRETEQSLYCPIRVTNGRPDTVSLATTSIGFTAVDCGFAGFPYDTLGTFCAEVAVTNNYSVELTNVYAELTQIAPDIGHNGYQFPNGTGANPNAVAPGNGAPSDALGLWGYGALGAGATGSTQWTMEFTPEPFSFEGRIAATVAETCDGLDNDCDGLIDEGARCYAETEACTENADCASFNCDVGGTDVCLPPIPEDCTLEGDEDGNELADCDDPVCSGLADPFGGTCPDTTSCVIDEVLGAQLGTFSGTTAGAGDDYPSQSSEDYTYVWEVPADGDYQIDLCGSSYDTRLTLLNEDCGDATVVSTNDDFCGLQSGFTLTGATAGDTYRIVVHGFSTSTGAYDLNISYDGLETDFGAGACIDGIDNDGDGALDCDDADCSLIDGCPATRGLCANPFVVGSYGTFTGSTASATDDNAPSGTCFSGTQAADHAYLFVAPATGQVTIDMTGSTIDTVIYVQSTCGDGLTEVACNDDQAFTNQDAQVTFGALEGSSYYIIVDGNGQAGDYSMTITGPEPPAYDCSGPGDTIGYGSYPGTISLTDTNTYQTCGAGLGGDRVYSFVSPASGTVTVDLDADFPASISIRETLCSDAGQEQGCQQGDGTAVTSTSFTATQNVEYFVFVDAVDPADVGAFTLTFAGPAGPAQTCAEPNLIPTFGTYFTNTAVGGLGNTETSSCGSSSSPEALFAWTAPMDMDVEATTEGSAFDTVLSVREADCSTGTELACNDDEAFPGITTSRVAFSATSGVTYYFLVQGFSTNSGNVVLTLEGPENLYAGASCSDGVDNDGDGFSDCLDNDCSNVDGCAPVTADSCVDTSPVDIGTYGPFTTSGNEFPDSATEDYAFLFTAPEDGDYVFETCSADFDTALAFYSGDCTGDRDLLGGVVFNPDNCPTGLGESFTVTGLVAGESLIVAVEGATAGEAGTFSLNMVYDGPETNITGATCADGIDNNNDGNTDCADLTCQGLDGCPAAPGTCGNPFTASIGAGNTGDTSVDGLSLREPTRSVGACTSASAGTSVEHVWEFVAPVDGTIGASTDTAGTTTHTDTTLYVRELASCTDDATGDLACDDDGGTTIGFNSVVTGVSVTAGTSYAIIVDGFGTADGAYDLEIDFVADVGQPGAGCQDPNATNYDPAAIYNDDSCVFPPENNLTFEFVATASFASEVSWELVDYPAGTVVLSEANEVTRTEYVADGCYEIVGTDSFGDGWDGWLLDITDGNATVLVDDFGTGFTTGSEIREFVSVNGGCPEGCTDPGADNFDAAALVDDGSCTYPASVQLLNDGADYLANDGGFTLYVSTDDTNAPSSACDATCQTTWPLFLAATPGVGAGLDSADFGTFSNAGDDQTTWFGWPLYTYTGDAATGDLNGDGVGTFVAARPGIFGCTDTNATNFSATASFDDGSCTYPAANYFLFTFDQTGSFAGEVSWQLIDISGPTVVIDNTDETDELTFLADGCYELVGVDSFGDGWNGPWLLDAIDDGGNGTAVIDDFTVLSTDPPTPTDTTSNTASTNLSVNGGCVFGCTDALADNYNAAANVDDGSCTYTNTGCTDPNATNYDPAAVADDGSCTYPPENLIDVVFTSGSFPGEVSWRIADLADADVIAEVAGPTDLIGQFLPTGCYEFVGYDSFGDSWNGHSVDVTDGNGTALITAFTVEATDPPRAGDASSNEGRTPLSVNNGCVFGCTDPIADNYNAGANVDDGSCTYSAPGCTDPAATNYDPAATFDDGSCTYPPENTLDFYFSATGSFASEVSWRLADLADADVIAEVAGPTDLLGQYVPDGCYELVAYDSFGDGWNGYEISVDDATPTTLVSGFTLDGSEPARPSDASSNEGRTFVSVDGPAAGAGCSFGCTDPAADNYDPAANADDGSCTYTLANTNLITVTVTPGFCCAGEHSWRIEDSSGTTIVSGSNDAGVVDHPFPTDGCYVFITEDSWGDGWDGASADVTDADGTVLVAGANAGGGSGASYDFGINTAVCP